MLPELPHTVVGGRLYFLDPTRTDLHTQAELQAIGQASVQVLRDKERLQFVVPSPPMPPIAPQFLRPPRPGHPDPETLSPLAQTYRPDQVQRILDARSLVDQGAGEYLHQRGRLWLVDDAPLFVADSDREIIGALQERLARGGLQAPRPEPIVPTPGPSPRITRVLPVGDQ